MSTIRPVRVGGTGKNGCSVSGTGRTNLRDNIGRYACNPTRVYVWMARDVLQKWRERRCRVFNYSLIFSKSVGIHYGFTDRTGFDGQGYLLLLWVRVPYGWRGEVYFVKRSYLSYCFRCLRDLSRSYENCRGWTLFRARNRPGLFCPLVPLNVRKTCNLLKKDTRPVMKTIDYDICAQCNSCRRVHQTAGSASNNIVHGVRWKGPARIKFK